MSRREDKTDVTLTREFCDNYSKTGNVHTSFIIINNNEFVRNCIISAHTPPEECVRAKKFFITFDTKFGRYLPRGTIIDGSRKCRIGAFCTIAKISGEMPKKCLNVKNRPKLCKFFFLALTHVE